MQCASCHFENMPSLQRCVRCGAFLGEALAGLDIAPPRAGRLRKRIREWFPLRKLYYGVREGLPSFDARSALQHLVPNFDISEITPGLALRMAVPGWAHAYLGHTHRGMLFAAMYFPFLLLGLLFLGTFAGAIMLGAAVAVHAASVIDLVMADMTELNARFFVTPAVVLCTVAAMYGVIGMMGGRYLAPRRLMEAALPFSAGDVVFVNPRAFASEPPRPGDVVLYNVPNANRTHQVRVDRGPPAVYRIVGERIDRVIAEPGSNVRWSRNTLRIDGRLSRLRPLNPDKLPEELSFTVPAGHYAILLTTDVVLSAQLPSAIWGNVCIVPAENIVGRAVFRSYPWTRWWWIE